MGNQPVNEEEPGRLEDLAREITAARRRVRKLQTRACEVPPSDHYMLLKRSFEEIQRSLEELQAADEELRRQHRDLDSAHRVTESERRRHDELFDQAREGYLVTALDGTIRNVNRAAARMLNAPKDFLIGQPLAIFCRTPNSGVTLGAPIGPGEVEEGHERAIELHPRRRNPVAAALTVRVIRDEADAPVALRWQIREASDSRERSRELASYAIDERQTDD